jgi:hypothetical protein
MEPEQTPLSSCASGDAHDPPWWSCFGIIGLIAAIISSWEDTIIVFVNSPTRNTARVLEVTIKKLVNAGTGNTFLTNF